MLDDIPMKYKFSKNSNEKNVISKNIKFDEEVGLKINNVIRIFNHNSTAIKLNNDLFLNIAANEYIKYLESIENCLTELKHKALEFEEK